jgi:uncharacterized repeat protein (TIGR03843 family)
VRALQDTSVALTSERILRLLTSGEIDVEGLIPWSSNATLLVVVRDDELGMREVAAYVVSESLGWGLVPPTVLRQGPHGLGSVQFFVHAQEDAHFFTIQDDPVYTEDLKRLAAFDLIANNADRKSGHCLVDLNGQLWAIDNALTFHSEPKLRTVIWDYASQSLPEDLLTDLQALQDILVGESQLGQALNQLLDEREVAAFKRRLRWLIEERCFPQPGPGRVVPWPLV